MLVEQTMYLICLEEGELPSRLESDWRTFVLCEMWKKKGTPGGLFSLFDLSLDTSGHTSPHTDWTWETNIKYATRWQQAVNKSHRVRIKLYEGQDGDFYPAVLSNRSVGRKWKRRNSLKKKINNSFLLAVDTMLFIFLPSQPAPIPHNEIALIPVHSSTPESLRVMVMR